MSDWLQSLKGEKYINLETFKKNGNGVKTPVWFAHDGDGIVFFTDSRSWKVKRLRRNDKVRIAACGYRGKVHGEWIDASCHRAQTPEDAKAVLRALTRKYWVLMPIGNAFVSISGRKKHRAFYRIVK